MRLSSLRDLGIILEKTALPFESQAVCNPTCIEKDGVVHMFYRAIAPGNRSSIGYCQLKDGKVIQRPTQPVLTPEFEYEKQGVEDPRIVLFEGLYYLFYTVYDGVSALVAYATSTDLIHFEKKHLLTPTIPYPKARKILHTNPAQAIYADFKDIDPRVQDARYLWEKDAFIFPERFNDSILFMHRVMPGIQVIPCRSLDELTDAYWERYLAQLQEYIVLEPKFSFESYKIGAGAVPIKTEKGWLLLYHGVELINGQPSYSACAALLSLDDPRIVIGRLPHPLFIPTEAWEKKGDMHNVVFPSGATLSGDTLTIYYGAADSRIGAKTVSLTELLEALTKK